MAYTLKTTGIATKLIACIAVDEDGTTVKDFVSGNTGTHHASIAVPKTGVATWKGTNRNWFKTDYGATWYDAQGFLWNPVEALPHVNGHSFFCAANSFDDTGASWLWSAQSGNHGLRMTAANRMEVYTAGGLRGTSTTAAPITTKLSIGVNIKNNGTSLPFYYGLESGSLAADGTYTVGDVVNAQNLILFGGLAGDASFYGKYHIACWFSDATLLTEAEFQSLHDDWFGTLFVPTTMPFAGAGLITNLRVSATPASGAFGIVYRITGTLANPATGAPLTNLTSVDCAFFDQATPSTLLAPTNTITNLSTDGSGNFSWLLPASALVAGQTGMLLAYHAVLGYLGAYRLQLVA